MSKVSPILFCAQMVLAVREGRKNQTRRVIKPKYSNTHIKWFTNKYGTRLVEMQNNVEGETFWKNGNGTTTQKLLACRELRPRYKKGQLLYVQETWKCVGTFGDRGYKVEFTDGTRVQFIFDDDYRANKWAKYRDKRGWQSPYFMPHEAARLFLRVTDVRAEQVQDISEADAMAEGADGMINPGIPLAGKSYRCGYSHLWDTLNAKRDGGKYAWAMNPWVRVYCFERCEKPKDFPQ